MKAEPPVDSSVDATEDAPGRIEDDGVDESQIRWMLSLTPMERLRVLQDFIDSVELLRRGRRVKLPLLKMLDEEQGKYVDPA